MDLSASMEYFRNTLFFPENNVISVGYCEVRTCESYEEVVHRVISVSTAGLNFVHC